MTQRFVDQCHFINRTMHQVADRLEMEKNQFDRLAEAYHEIGVQFHNGAPPPTAQWAALVASKAGIIDIRTSISPDPIYPNLPRSLVLRRVADDGGIIDEATYMMPPLQRGFELAFQEGTLADTFTFEVTTSLVGLAKVRFGDFSHRGEVPPATSDRDAEIVPLDIASKPSHLFRHPGMHQGPEGLA